VATYLTRHSKQGLTRRPIRTLLDPIEAGAALDEFKVGFPRGTAKFGERSDQGNTFFVEATTVF